MWAAANEMSLKHVGEGVEVVNGIWWESSEPFEGRAFEGGWKGFAEDGIMGRIEDNMGYVYFEVLVGVGFSRITVPREGFPFVTSLATPPWVPEAQLVASASEPEVLKVGGSIPTGNNPPSMNGRRRVRGWGASGCSNLTASGTRGGVARDVT